jgi:hypothetical protein
MLLVRSDAKSTAKGVVFFAALLALSAVSFMRVLSH